jgi:hypothetical protein
MQTHDIRHTSDLVESNRRVLDRLGSLCAMEASAIRSYENALAAPQMRSYRHALRALRDSHEERQQLLDERLRLAGGQAAGTLGIGDSLVSFMEDMGVALGASAAFKAFDRGEAHFESEYKKAMAELDSESRTFLEREILPRQISSHALISTIRRES